MAAVAFDTSYFRTRSNAPEAIRGEIALFLRTLADLPAPAPLAGDDEVDVPPIARYWRHVLGTTGWCIHYTVRAGDVYVRNVTTRKAF